MPRKLGDEVIYLDDDSLLDTAEVTITATQITKRTGQVTMTVGELRGIAKREAAPDWCDIAGLDGVHDHVTSQVAAMDDNNVEMETSYSFDSIEVDG